MGGGIVGGWVGGWVVGWLDGDTFGRTRTYLHSHLTVQRPRHHFFHTYY